MNFNIFGGFQKNEYFWGYENFTDIFWGHPKIEIVLGFISIYFRVFVNIQNRYIFWVTKIPYIFWGCLILVVMGGTMGTPSF